MKEIEIYLHPNKNTKFVNKGWDVHENPSFGIQNDTHYISVMIDVDGIMSLKVFDLDDNNELNNEILSQEF